MSISGTTQCSSCGSQVNQEGVCSSCGVSRGDANGRAAINADRADMLQMPRRQGSKQTRPAILFNKLTNESFPLIQSVSKIGRDQTNNISLNADHYISRHHAWVLQMQGGYWVEDLGSTNGTLLNGEVLNERRQIFPGDKLTFGKTELVFVVE